MASGSQGRQSAQRRVANNRRSGGSYVYGNAARRLDVTHAIEEKPRKRISSANRKNREKARLMNPGYVLFLGAAIVAAGVIIGNYLSLQSEVTNYVKTISKLESQLLAMRLTNDENYNRIESSVSLEEIKRIAIDDLGMRYAKEGQIVVYDAEGSDYVRQVSDLPE